jgi:putative ABC transport system permease protein
VNPLAWFWRRSRLDDLSEEIQSHIDEKADELVTRGLSRHDAEREARRAFGNVTQVREAAGDVWGFDSLLESVTTDVRYAHRGLIQKPGFSIAVVLTLALGIGANAVVFALVNAVVLKPLPYPNSDRLISVGEIGDEGRLLALTDFTYAEWAKTTKTVAMAAAYDEIPAVIALPDGPVRVSGLRVTHSYFSIFGARPIVGRLFDSTEAIPGAPQVVVLSEKLWRGRFGSDTAIVGRTVSFDGTRRLVVGILPKSFTYGRPEEFWIPFRVAPVKAATPQMAGEIFGYSVVARMRDGVSPATVRAELATVAARLHIEALVGERNTPVVMSLHERWHGESRKPLLLLFGGVGVLLLTACANIANLTLARAGRREREFAVRLALGASRWRIVRFVLIENLVISTGGALLGLLLVNASLGWFVRLSPGSVQSVEVIGVDQALIAYLSVVVVVTALLFGLVPALAASRSTLNDTLSNGTPIAAGSRRQSFARRALVVGELAIALVFLTGAGLVAKTFWRVTNIDHGFRPERLIAASFDMRTPRYTNASAIAFVESIMERVRHEPSVQSITYADATPSGGGMTEFVVMVSRRGAKGDGEESRFGVAGVGPNYFETIGAELIEGRFLGPGDRPGAARVAVVTESFVRINLKGEPALGHSVLGGGPNDRNPTTIVGVIKDLTGAPTLDKRELAMVFRPLAQQQNHTFLRLIVRTTDAPERIQAPIRAAVRALDPVQPEAEFTTVEHELAETVAPRRFTLILLGVFALLAASLAVVGLYSVLAYLVSERTREIGIRVALGADAGRVMRMVLGQGLRLTLVGTVLGAAVSIVAVRVLRAWMYEMSVYDAPTFLAVAASLGIVALLASWLPARRASRVDPVLALRAD